MLKSQGVNSKCTYGVTLPREYLQVARWWQTAVSPHPGATRGAVLGRAPPPTTRVTRQLRITRRLRVIYRLHCRNFGVPTKETIQVYSHLGTHATPAVKSSKWKIVTVTYECTEPPSAALPLMALYVTCSSGAPSPIITSSREPLEIKHKK